MTLRSRILSLFPFVHALFTLSGVVWVIRALAAGHWTQAGCALATALAALYLLPVAAYRIHEQLFPLREGVTSLQGNAYSPWWGGHLIQNLFITFPQIESALHLVPGLFSLWLRLWGSRIGRGVTWTPRVEVLDRALVEVGDFAVFGHLSAVCSHVVTSRGGTIKLYVRKVRIGAGALVGAEARLGPGTRVAPGAELPHGTKATVNSVLGGVAAS